MGAGAFDAGGHGFDQLVRSGTRLGTELVQAVNTMRAEAELYRSRLARATAKQRKLMNAHLRARGGVVGTAAVVAAIEAEERERQKQSNRATRASAAERRTGGVPKPRWRKRKREARTDSDPFSAAEAAAEAARESAESPPAPGDAQPQPVAIAIDTAPDDRRTSRPNGHNGPTNGPTIDMVVGSGAGVTRPEGAVVRGGADRGHGGANRTHSGSGNGNGDLVATAPEERQISRSNGSNGPANGPAIDEVVGSGAGETRPEGSGTRGDADRRRGGGDGDLAATTPTSGQCSSTSEPDKPSGADTPNGDIGIGSRPETTRSGGVTSRGDANGGPLRRQQQEPQLAAAAAFLNGTNAHRAAQRVLTAGLEHMRRSRLLLDALSARTLPKKEWHAQSRGAELKALAARTWFLATDECSRQVLTCLPGGDTAIDNRTFATAINCIMGGLAPQLREKVGRPIVVPKRGGAPGEVRTDGALKMPLDAMGTNLLACEVGGRGGGFDRRHDNFRDALMREARRASYSTKREFAFGVGDGMAAAHEALLRGAAAVETADAGASLSPEDRTEVDYAAAQAAVAAAMRTLGADRERLRASCGSAQGMRADLGLQRRTADAGWAVYEVKTMGFCKTRYHVRNHSSGRSWADHRAAAAIQERHNQAAELDTGLFRGVQPPPMGKVIEDMGGVRALVVGGCCELNTEAHQLLAEIGGEIGMRSAAESGEDLQQSIQLDVQRVRQRVSIQIWRDYQDHINARMRYADPSNDEKAQNIDESEREREETAIATQRLYNQAYLQRRRRPQEFGV